MTLPTISGPTASSSQLSDLIVVVPGILGSVLVRDGRTVWGYTKIARHLTQLRTYLVDHLTLPDEAYIDASNGWDDGVRAVGLMQLPSVLPGLTAMDGYGDLLSTLGRRLNSRGCRVVGFPYDWRQSNAYSASLLAQFVHDALADHRTRHRDAKVVFIGHSMGGLVAQFFAECLDLEGITRRVITVGTPFEGATRALHIATSGSVKFGPFSVDLRSLVQTFPSISELLPTYRCIRINGAPPVALRSVADMQLVPDRMMQQNLEFHGRISDARLSDSGSGEIYSPIASYSQMTLTELDVGATTTGLEYEEGDGTVPRCSAYPALWTDDAGAFFVSGRHSTLHQSKAAYVQYEGVITARSRRPQAASDAIGIDAEPCVERGAPWVLRARSHESSDRLVLTLLLRRAGSETVLAKEPVRPAGDGEYSSSVRVHEPGLYRWTVESNLGAGSSVDAVSDILLVV